MLHARFLSGFVQIALQIFSIPGVIFSLPILNLVASPLWAIGVIGILNGVTYGFSAWLSAHWLRKRRAIKR